MEIINTEAITKHFGTTIAAEDISLHVNQGEIYGFLGLNGAGKTTLIRMLLGMIRPDGGNVQLFGCKLTRSFPYWNNIGYLVETPHAYPNLTVLENLKVYFQLRQLDNPSLIIGIIEKLKLSKYQNVKAKVLSLGNQQRLGLAKALLHRPKLLILDEPTNGLDPEGIVEVRLLLKDLAYHGTTIFLSSHILGEISKVVDRIGIIHYGRLIKELTKQELAGQLIKKVIVNTQDNAKAIALLTDAKYEAALSETNEIEISDDRAIAHPEKISSLLVEEGLPLIKITLFTEDLEKFFLRIIKTGA